jgi:hypothetical protein
MKNKHFILLAAGVFLAICLILKLYHRHPVSMESSPPEANQETSAQPQSAPMPPLVQTTNNGTTQNTNGQQLAPQAERDRKKQAIIDQNLNEWKTPIEFYGIVEDESNNVIANAKIDFQCNDLSPDGTSFYHTESDVDGAFSIKNISGKLLRVTVSKSGYYSYQPNGAFFYYAGQNQNFVPDAGRPVVFYLRARGAGTNLIHYDKSFRLPRNGTPVVIDLPSGTVTQSSGNSMKVEGWTYDSQKIGGFKYDWTCRVSVPGGGLQTNDEAFPFLAPDSDYVTDDAIDMPVTNTVQWSYIVSRHYFVRTADGNFGRMIFTMVAGGDNFCEINLYFNPSGSKNLEPVQH